MIKRIGCMLILGVLTGSLYAGQGDGRGWRSGGYVDSKKSLRDFTFDVSLDYIKFFDDDWAKAVDIDNGAFIGGGIYGRIAPNVYLGGESGYFRRENTDDDTFKLEYIPLEVNVKYAPQLTKFMVIEVGGGPSYNYVKSSYKGYSWLYGEIDSSASDWVLGLQLFAKLDFTFRGFFFGVHGKGQITEEIKNSDDRSSNYRAGLHLGGRF